MTIIRISLTNLKMHDIFNSMTGKETQCITIQFVRIFGFHAVPVEFKKEVVHTDIKVPHKIKKKSNIFN